MNSAVNEEAVREEVSDRLGRELPDSVWADMYGRAERKLRHIITHFGDADGARNTVDYIAQLTIEAIQAEALTQYTLVMYGQKREGADANADPQGHTSILPRTTLESQAVFA